MLSERVLGELIRNSALSQELVKALWPDLSAESKLQLLDAYHADFSPSTPAWLTDLAIDDRSAVVQYFALRHAYLRPRREDVAEKHKRFFQTTDEDVARHAKAQALEHPLAKAAAASFSAFDSKEQLCSASQLERLVHVRNQSSFSLGALVDFLQTAVDKVDDRELAAVAYEYFQRPDTKRELRRDRLYYLDGMSAYYEGQGVTKGWELVRRAGPALVGVMVPNLPTSLGLGTVGAEELATMPEEVLEHLAYNSFERKEVDELHKMMLAEPERFPEKAIKALANDFDAYDPKEVERARRMASPFGEHTILEAVLELQNQVAMLAEQIQDMRENPPKRGLFG